VCFVIKKNYVSIITIGSYAFMIVMNFLANAIPIGGVTTGRVSDQYFNLFAPAGITFSIWGVIYLLLFFYVLSLFNLNSDINQDLKKRKQVNLLFSLSSIANGLWILAWHYKALLLSVLLMVVILFSLAAISILVKHLKGLTKIAFGVYFGWITIATIANITIYLVSINGYTNVAMNLQTVLILFIGMLIASVTLYRQNDLFYGAVIVWAYLGIYMKHVDPFEFDRGYPSIIDTSLISIGIILVVMGLTFYLNHKKKTPNY